METGIKTSRLVQRFYSLRQDQHLPSWDMKACGSSVSHRLEFDPDSPACLTSGSTCNSGPDANASGPVKPAPKCNCGVLCERFTSTTAANPGRPFYCCRKPKNSKDKCSYFEWI